MLLLNQGFFLFKVFPFNFSVPFGIGIDFDTFK